MNKKTAKVIEVELIVILAVVILLGFIVGYSLAAAKTSQTLSQPTETQRFLPGDDI